MAAPTFDSGDCYATGCGSGTGDGSPPVGHQAHNNGDLVIQICGFDDNKPTGTAPANGLDGETLLADIDGESGTAGPPGARAA